MLAPTLMVFPTTVQSPVPTSSAPVTRTDDLKLVEKVGSEMSIFCITASVLTLSDPLQNQLPVHYITRMIGVDIVTCICWMSVGSLITKNHHFA